MREIDEGVLNECAETAKATSCNGCASQESFLSDVLTTQLDNHNGTKTTKLKCRFSRQSAFENSTSLSEDAFTNCIIPRHFTYAFSTELPEYLKSAICASVKNGDQADKSIRLLE